MPPTAEVATTLAGALADLPLVVSTATCAIAPAAVPSYPGGVRPHSVVTLAGDGTAGHGEHVGWTDAAHAAFARTVRGLPSGRWRLSAWSAALRSHVTDPYDRAALEAAAIDLALRQRGTNLFRLAEGRPRPVRYVVSFGRTADPVAEARRHPERELKLDVDPGWDASVWAALADLGRIAVVDFKGAGEAAEHERAHEALPAALIEDPAPRAAPWSAALRRRLSFDAPLATADDLERLPVRPAAVNVKPARMGGVLEALTAVRRAAEAAIAIYFGGMFEIGIGRAQLAVLAALLAPDAPNDIGPVAVGDHAPWRPPRLDVDADAIGFGAA